MHDSAGCVCSQELKIHTHPTKCNTNTDCSSSFILIIHFPGSRCHQEGDACGVLPTGHLCSSWRGRCQQGRFKGPSFGSFGLMCFSAGKCGWGWNFLWKWKNIPVKRGGSIFHSFLLFLELKRWRKHLSWSYPLLFLTQDLKIGKKTVQFCC